MSESILDKIIDSAHQQQMSKFEPEVILSELLAVLDEREAEIIGLRYGLSHDRSATLEEIGKRFAITRERVRQIESGAIAKIKASEAYEKHAQVLIEVVETIIEHVGGIISEDRLLGQLIQLTDSPRAEAIIKFLMQKLLHHHFVQLKKSERLLKSWMLHSTIPQRYEKLVSHVEDILNELEEIIALDDLHSRVVTHPELSEYQDIATHIFENILHASTSIDRNAFGYWGFKKWSLISPKRMNDKIYLVLKNHGKPLHFTEIAEKINETNFDHKKAHPATVHNELILDNNRYVLIGRGIYALKEWGYKSGVVTDIIKDVLQKNGPLTKDEIISYVLKQRMVKESTIALMLTNKKMFVKISDGRYELIA